MIRFVLGEDRHVKYFVHANKNEYFIINKATYILYCNRNIEDAGECQIDKDEKNGGYYIDAKISPERRSTRYSLEITLEIADEIIKNLEDMEVI